MCQSDIDMLNIEYPDQKFISDASNLDIYEITQVLHKWFSIYKKNINLGWLFSCEFKEMSFRKYYLKE